MAPPIIEPVWCVTRLKRSTSTSCRCPATAPTSCRSRRSGAGSARMSPIITVIPPPRISAGEWPLSRTASITTPAPSPIASGSKITSTLTKKNYASQSRRGLAAEAAEIISVVAKLRALIRPDVARRVEPDLEALLEAEGIAMCPGPRLKVCTEVVVKLRQAIKVCCKVRIIYKSRGNRETKERLVHPYGFLHGHRNYLVAWHENPKANKVALFSLPNIERAELTEQPFIREPSFDLQQFAARSFGLFQGEEQFDTVWRFAPHATETAQKVVFPPPQTMKRPPDGTPIVCFWAGGDPEKAWAFKS